LLRGFSIGTSAINTRYRSGRSTMAIPIAIPPALLLYNTVVLLAGILFLIKYYIQSMSSFQELYFLDFMPCSCQESPFSPPPRIWGTAKTPPFFTQVKKMGEKKGVINSPYAP